MDDDADKMYLEILVQETRDIDFEDLGQLLRDVEEIKAEELLEKSE